MIRTKEEMLRPLPESSIASLTLEVAIDTRDQLRRIANALEANHRLPHIVSGEVIKKPRHNAWASKEKIACPLCFKKHKNIKLHVLRKHNMSLDEAQRITTK